MSLVEHRRCCASHTLLLCSRRAGSAGRLLVFLLARLPLALCRRRRRRRALLGAGAVAQESRLNEQESGSRRSDERHADGRHSNCHGWCGTFHGQEAELRPGDLQLRLPDCCLHNCLTCASGVMVKEVRQALLLRLGTVTKLRAVWRAGEGAGRGVGGWNGAAPRSSRCSTHVTCGSTRGGRQSLLNLPRPAAVATPCSRTCRQASAPTA